MIHDLRVLQKQSNDVFDSYNAKSIKSDEAITIQSQIIDTILSFEKKYFKQTNEVGITDESALVNYNPTIANIYFNRAVINFYEKNSSDKIHSDMDKVIERLYPIYKAEGFTDFDFYHLESAYGIKMMLSAKDMEKVYNLSKLGIEIGSKKIAFYQAFIDASISKQLYNESLPCFQYIIDNKLLSNESLAELYQLRGTVYDKLGNNKEALKNYKKAKKLGYKEKT
jgi:tetratricopeptide (TPR) repeat protein